MAGRDAAPCPIVRRSVRTVFMASVAGASAGAAIVVLSFLPVVPPLPLGAWLPLFAGVLLVFPISIVSAQALRASAAGVASGCRGTGSAVLVARAGWHCDDGRLLHVVAGPARPAGDRARRLLPR